MAPEKRLRGTLPNTSEAGRKDTPGEQVDGFYPTTDGFFWHDQN